MMASEVFRGASTHTLDDKARLIVPKRFMDRLPKVDNNFVLTALKQMKAGDTVTPDETRPWGCSVKYAKK